MIFIVIPVFNRKELTRKCLASIRKQSFADNEVILVDDGSTDGTSEMIKQEFPEVYVIKGNGNLWWAGATNAGVSYVLERGYNELDFILTLNNDLELPEDYLQILVNHSTLHEKAILGSVSVDIANTDRMDFCGVTWNEFTGRYYLKAKSFNYSYKRLISEKQIIYSDLLSGRGTLIPVKVFAEIGLYDSQNFPQYAADEDFSLRAKRKGWNLVVPSGAYLKSHVKETGADVANVELSLKYYKHIFFSIKSPLNLRIRYRWAIKNTKLKFLYFLMDSMKVLLSFSFKTIRKILTNSF